MLLQYRQPADTDLFATIKTNHGDVKLRLFPEAAPRTVQNFVEHARSGYYNGVIFHRVIQDFMIQGGDPTGTGMGGESIYGETFEDEFHQGARNFYGAISMANRGPNTNGSQFFIITANHVPDNIIRQMREIGAAEGYTDQVIDAYEKHGGAYWLDGKHAVFGHVVEGMDVIEEISRVQTNSQDRPTEDVVIEEIIVE